MVMHKLIKDRLEDYLKGAPDSRLPADCEQHLKVCEECRDELNLMQEQSYLIQVLRTREEIDPSPGFYARVTERIEAQQTASIWSVFLEPAFGRRLAAASLALILLLGGYLAFSENDSAYQPATAETIMAVHEDASGLGLDQQRDRDRILVTLATYQE